ncbi:hypothetical protein FN846DRAFT_992268 [Sphaerosporella brunnea]|uniref:Tc1-like transposase DDE domain-containing protein n=1 Tax=Sphaerosporella brunnea TaxID=1250544 RepID=A0A5J5ENS2_9PEZI|nr:hypothetical protein FN846DRAFT_992268 [Sphaerosporella brunnea]
MPNTGVGKTLSPTWRGAILALRFSDRKNRPTVRQIADLLNLPKSTVHDVCKHAMLRSIAKRGREKVEQKENDAASLAITFATLSITADASAELENRVITGGQGAEPANRVVAGDSEQPEVPLTRLLAAEEVPLRVTGFNHVSLMTILNVLDERVITAYREEFKFILKPENKVQRLVYCQERKDWRPDKEWAQYGFTDEVSIEIGSTFGISRVWRSKDENHEEDCRGATKKNKATVVVWVSTLHLEKPSERKHASRLRSSTKKLKSKKRGSTQSGKKTKNGDNSANRNFVSPAAEETNTKAPATTQSFRGKKHKLKCSNNKGDGKGIDSWRYIKYACRPILWPVCKELATTDPEFILTKDNAPGHNCWYTNAERQKAGIRKVNRPPDSSDFSPIERIWLLMEAVSNSNLSCARKDNHFSWYETGVAGTVGSHHN